MKRRYTPKLNPQVDLAGAAPETLVRALLGKPPRLGPGPGREPVVGDEQPVGERTAREPGHDRPHLIDGVQSP